MIFKAQQQEIPQVKLIARKPAKEKKVSKKQRFLLVSFFLLTVVLSLGFYLKTEFSSLKKRLSQPLVISNIPQSKFDPSSVLREVEDLVKDLRGTYGVYVYRFADKNEYGLNEEEVFPAASLMKLPVMLLVYQGAEKKELNLDDYQELVRMMGQRSDNAAYTQLVKFFGSTKIQGLIEGLEMKNTFLAKDDTTPRDIGLFFRELYLGNLINRIHKEEFLSFLTQTIFEDRIPAGVPAGIRVAHKIGTEIGSYSDAGIVFGDPPAGGFVLVIMSVNAREAEATEVLPKIAAAVWDFESKTKEKSE